MALTTEQSKATDWWGRVRARRGALIAAWLLPVMAWGIGTLYLGGALGKSTDDYSINLRDPVTGAVPVPFDPMARYPFFWRPLHNTLCFGVGTLWPEADRVVHVLVALMHGLACVALWVVLRRMTVSRLAAAGAALLFMAMPLNGEVAFWFCTTSTAIGTVLFFGAALVAARFAGLERGGWWLLGVVFLLMFAVACFYEQAAAPAAALPVLCFARRRREGRNADGSAGVLMRVGRTLLATGAAGVACVLYVALLVGTAPPNSRGGSESLVTAERTVERLGNLAHGIKMNLVGERAQQIVKGSVTVGWEVLSSPKGLVLGAMLLAAGVLWLVWATRRGGVEKRKEGEESSAFVRPAWLVVAGIVVFCAAWLPVYAVARQVVELRMTYVPLLGVAMVVAGVLDAVVIAAGRMDGRVGAGVRLGIGVVTLGLVGVGVVGLVGYQTYFQRRAQEDQREIATLKELFPKPPYHTVFVPLRSSTTPTHTGYTLFDRARYGVFETPWSAQAAIAWALRRDDVAATACNPWLPPPGLPVDKPGEDGVRWMPRLTPEMRTWFAWDPDKGPRIPWTNMVPFVLEGDGRIRLVRRVDVERADHRDLEIRPPLVHEVMAARKDVPTTTVRMVEGDADKRLDLIPMEFWEYADGKAAEFVEANVWEQTRRATWLAADAGARASMSISMPPMDREEYLLIRASIGAYDLDPARNPVVRVQELVVTMKDAPEKELAVLKMDPLQIRAMRKWVPLVVTLPARRAPSGGRIVVTVRAVGEAVRTDPGNKTAVAKDAPAVCPPVWVTHGYEQAKVE